MKQTNLLNYEAPQVEIIDLEIEGIIASSGEGGLWG